MENTLLNLIPAAYLPEIHLSQYDVGRTITFTLKDGASDYSVPSGASVKVKATKPSGFGFEVACTFNGGTVTLVTTDTMTPENGRFPAELSIVSGNTTIGTSNFIFNIERSPHPEGTIDGDAETIIPELTLLVERIEAAAEDVDEKAELFLNLSAEAETLPAGSLATASYSDGVLTLGIPRGYDGDDTKADAIIKSASGEIASFTDGGNGLLVKSLNVNITPKQSGSGDPSPSNVRPISGYDSVNVKRIGKNILAYDRDNGSYVSGGLTYTITDGHINVNGTSTSNYPTLIVANPLPLKAGTYTISKTVNGTVPSGAYLYIIVENSGLPNDPSVRGGNSFTFTLTEDRDVRIVLCAETSGKTWNNVGVDFQIERGSTATAYEPYQGNTYPISLGRTVYGGTLEVMSGKLTIEKVKTTLGSVPTTGNPSAYGSGVYTSLPCPTDDINRGKWSVQSGALPIFDRYGGDISKGYSANNYTLFFNEVLTKAEIDSMLANAEMVYKLKTPTEIQLTPTEVKTLLGNNNIFADSGSVEVEYRADTTLAYNELLSLIASL